MCHTEGRGKGKVHGEVGTDQQLYMLREYFQYLTEV